MANNLIRALVKGRSPLIEVSDHSVLVSRLTSSSVVLDLGANHGRFSYELATTYGCKCYLVEANPAIVGELSSGPFSGVAHGAAVGHDRRVTFAVADCDLQSRIVSEGEPAATHDVSGLSYSSILKIFGVDRVDVLKLDIEGAEIELLDAMTNEQLSAIEQITVEFHDFVPLYPRSEVHRILRRLKRLGFVNLSPNYGTYDVLMVNRALVNTASAMDALFAAIVTRPVLRVLRESTH